MPKTKISEFSVTPGDNTDIDGINIDEGCSPANLNNALRELMSQLKDFQVGNQTSNQLAIAGGGTGATTAADARTNLGLGTMATQAASSVAITGGSIAGITDLALADGGTGASTAADARTNLGLGTIATQAASSVAITGGSITGITDLAIADGGTGASTAADARTNLGLVIGTNVPSPTGTGASGTWAISISGNAATATSATSATSATTATSATNVTGTVAVANGGTGSTSASGARTNLGLAIGSDIPSNTGTGASGTWGINITGNAATASNAGVTSVNSQTGAVVTTTLGNVGSMLYAAANTTSLLKIGDTISGSSLYYPTSLTSYGGGYYSQGGQTFPRTQWPSGDETWVTQESSGSTGYVAPAGNVSTLSGTWRCMSIFVRPRDSGEADGYTTSYTYMGLFVRVS